MNGTVDLVRTLLSKSVVTLVLVSFVPAVLWHLEVRFNGWADLGWVWSTRYSIYLGLILFVAWLAFNVEAGSVARKYIFLVVGGLVLLPIHFHLTERFVSMFFITGPMAWLLPRFETPLLLWPILSGLAVMGMARITRVTTSWRRILLAVILLYSSPYLGMALNYLVFCEWNGYMLIDGCVASNDLIHTFKTGAIIPFLIIAIGLPFVKLRSVRDDRRA